MNSEMINVMLDVFQESLQQTKENYELLLEKSREDKESAIKELTEENTKQTEVNHA